MNEMKYCWLRESSLAKEVKCFEDSRVCEEGRSISADSEKLREEGVNPSTETSIRSQEIHRGECRRVSKPYGYIYITENLINHKKYIGQHKSEVFDESYKGSGKFIRQALKDYGWDNFKTEIIEWCESKEELNEREIYWIAYYDASRSRYFYNILSGGDGVSSEDVSDEKNPRYGVKVPKEVRKKISDSLSRENNINYLKAKPLDERKRISESHKGIIPTDETRELLSIRSKERCRSKKGSNKFLPIRVIQYSLEMEEIQRFNSISEASEATKCNATCISNVCKGKGYSTGGYIWRYEDPERDKVYEYDKSIY